MDIKEEGLIKGDIAKHWYYRAKLAALHRMLAQRDPTLILDVGAGLGFFSGSLLESTNAWAATCVDPGYPEDRDEERVGKPLFFRRSVQESDADLVLLMDVIEHVEDVGPVTRIRAKGGSRNPIHRDGSRVYVVVERSRRVLGARPPLHAATDRASPSGRGPHRRTRVLFLRRRAASRCPFARGGTIEEARS